MTVMRSPTGDVVDLPPLTAVSLMSEGWTPVAPEPDPPDHTEPQHISVRRNQPKGIQS